MRRIKTIISKLRKPVNVMGLGWVCLLFFTLNSSLLTFTSCSSDPVSEEPEVKQGTAIAFSGNMMEEEVTRAESTTPLNEKGVTSFRVWAFKNDGPQNDPYSTYQTVMPGYYVRYEASSSSTTNSSGWEYILTAFPDQTPKYWDMEAKAYRFFAVTAWEGTPPELPENYMASKTYGTYGTANQTYQVSMLADASGSEEIAATPYFSELWFSTGDVVDYPDKQFGKAVQLRFIKPFAKVRFLFRDAYPTTGPNAQSPSLKEDPHFRPSTVGSKIHLSGLFTVTYPLMGTETKESWVTSNIDETKILTEFNVAYTEENNQWYTVLPVLNQGNYRMTVDVDKKEKTCEVPGEYMNWQPGYSYTYIFKVLEEGGIEFESLNSGYTDWKEGKEGSAIFYNW